MYTSIKSFILKIVPRRLLFRYEYALRYFYYLFYKGTKYQCNLCRKGLSNFVSLKNERLCPRCGSLQRTRRLYQIVNDGFLNPETEILHCSPSRSIYRVLKKQPHYLSSDLSENFWSDVSFDITKIDSVDESFDLIIGYHILEHIEEDKKAMQELFRVLKFGGTCIIQTPFKEGDTYEDSTITAPEDRKQHFGQSDHVRIYAVDGLQKRLEQAGFCVDVNEFTSDYTNTYGLSPNEKVLICKKPIQLSADQNFL
ncbi:methyltransferase family protein [Leeuwenhoekiella aestuarii]|nr:methyltransferase family protein [Leeuwenhoekiella aestuarii]